jgi:hypothetical protein
MTYVYVHNVRNFLYILHSIFLFCKNNTFKGIDINLQKLSTITNMIMKRSDMHKSAKVLINNKLNSPIF